MTIVLAFDGDGTVTKGIPPGPIPISWVRKLSEHPDNEVYAIGNQTLRWAADIPGRSDILSAHEEDLSDQSSRTEYLCLLTDIHADASKYIVVDDINLDEMEPLGWTYYTLHQFYESFVDTDEVGVQLPKPDYVPERSYPVGGYD